MTKRYALRDDQWEQIKDLLPGRVSTVGVTAKDNRLFVEAVSFRYSVARLIGTLWGFLHTRFSRWAKAGVWQIFFEVLSHDGEYAMLDSTIVRAHQHSTGKKIRRSDAVKVA